MTDEQFKELTDRLWNERVLFSSKGDPIIFRMHFDSAIKEVIEQAKQHRYFKDLSYSITINDEWND